MKYKKVRLLSIIIFILLLHFDVNANKNKTNQIWINNGLQFLEKIGVYGNVRHKTHELYGEILLGQLNNNYVIIIFQSENFAKRMYIDYRKPGRKDFLFKKVLVSPKKNKNVSQKLKKIIVLNYDILKTK